MKKEIIVFFVVILILFTSCSAHNSDMVDSESMLETYNALTENTSTITIGDTVYRNRFQGDFVFVDLQFKEPVFVNESFEYYRIEDSKYDIIFNGSADNPGAAENVYCRDDQWNELKDYYAKPTNFSYQCVVAQKGKDNATYLIDKIDANKLYILIDFCNKYSYNPSSLNRVVDYRAVSSEILNTPKYVFTVTSNDNLVSASTGYLLISDNKLVLKNHSVMSEKKVLVVDVPNELSVYFLEIIKMIK